MKTSLIAALVVAAFTTAMAVEPVTFVTDAVTPPETYQESEPAAPTPAPQAPVAVPTATTPAAAPQAPVPTAPVVDEGRTWYWRPLRPAELLDRKVRHLRLAQTDAEVAADAAAAALAKVTKADLDRRNAVAIVRPLWFDTSADAVKGASLLKLIRAAHLADEESKAAAKVQMAANDLEAASRRLLGRVEREIEVAAMNVRGNVGAATRDAAAATGIAETARSEEERRAAAVPAKQGNL